MKAIAIARVSSDAQEIEGQSLDAQIARINTYVDSQKLDLIHSPYTIVESSTKGERKEFMKILNNSLIPGETIAIVVETVDRFQRGFKESEYCYDLMQRDQIQLHFINERLILHRDSPAIDILSWDFSVISAKQYVLKISSNVKRTFEYKLSKGQTIGKLPIGYLNIRVDDGKGGTYGMGQVDPLRGHLVKKAFELYSTGTYSQRSLAKKMRKLGLTKNTKKGGLVTKKDIEHMLVNPIYYGDYVIRGKVYHHTFGNIITRDLFNKCLTVTESRKSNMSRPYNNRPYIFRGLIKCAKCGNLCTPYKGKLQNYIRCTKSKEDCGNENVAERIVLAQLEDIFKNLVIPEDVMDRLTVEIKKYYEGKILYEKELREDCLKKINRYTGQLDELLNMKLDKSITLELYDKKALEINGKLTEQNELLARISEANKTYADTLVKLLDISMRAWEIFQGSSIDRKRQLLGLVTLNLKLDNKKLIVDLKKPFEGIYKFNKTGKWGGRFQTSPIC